MTLAEARTILADWRNRTVETHALALAADKLLAKEWRRRKKARAVRL